MATSTVLRATPVTGVGRRVRRAAAGTVAVAALAVALGACAWLVLAAAERPSILSPPSYRSPQPWLLGPASGLLPHLTTDVLQLHADLSTALVVLAACWVLAWIAAPALPVAVVAVVVGLAQLIFLIGPPQPLTDLFNYIVYGRMAASGLNPYTHLPLSAPHDTAYALSNWHHLPSPYGPLFTLLSEPVAQLPLPGAYWAFKVLIVGSALATLWLVWWLARRFGCSQQRALVAVGLCPVTLAVGLGGFHNDTPAMLCLIGAVACLVRGRDDSARWTWDASAGLLVVAAAGLKPSFAVVAPLVVVGCRRRLAAAAGAAVGTALVGLVVLTAFGGHLPAIGIQERLVDPLSIPNLVGAATGHGGADAAVRHGARDALAVVVVTATAAVAWRRRWALPAMGIVLFAAVLSLGWIMPWYLAWSLPFAALAAPRALVPLAVAACVWLGVAGSPQMPDVVHAFHWYPTRSATGHANHELEIHLVS